MPENAPTKTAAADEGATPENTLHGVVLDTEKGSPRVLFIAKDNPELKRRLGELMDDKLLVKPVRDTLRICLKLLVGKDTDSKERAELEKAARAFELILAGSAELVLLFKSVTNTKQEKVPVFELLGTDEACMNRALALAKRLDEQAKKPAPSPASLPPHDTQPIASATGDTHVGEVPLNQKPANPDLYFDPVDQKWINITDPTVSYEVKRRAMTFAQKAATSSEAASETLRRQRERK